MLLEVGGTVCVESDLAHAGKVEILPVYLSALSVSSNEFPALRRAGDGDLQSLAVGERIIAEQILGIAGGRGVNKTELLNGEAGRVGNNDILG